MNKKNLLIYSICISLNFVFCCKIQASDKTKYLPTQLAYENKYLINILYNDLNQIHQIQYTQNKGDSIYDTVDYVYYFNKDQLQQTDLTSTRLFADSIINTGSYSNSYKYLTNDSTIHILIDKTTDTEQYKSNPEITISLNKDKLPYKYVYSEMNKGDTSIYTIKYDDRKRIVKIEEYSKYKSPIHIELKRIWEVLEFDSPPYKSIYSDINLTYLQYIIMMTDPMFVITTIQNTKRIKLTETIDQEEASISYTNLSYKYNDKGYPTQVISQQYYNTHLSEDKGKGVVLDINYKPIK